MFTPGKKTFQIFSAICLVALGMQLEPVINDGLLMDRSGLFHLLRIAVFALYAWFFYHQSERVAVRSAKS
ncbi:MAG: hypothetical protein ACPF9D_02650 [Owenweeksia sp.]